LEERRLSRHLERCPSCRVFATSVVEFTNELRTAPLAAPENTVSSLSGMRRRRPRVALRLTLATLTSAAAATLIVSVVLKEHPPGTHVSTLRPSATVSIAPDDDLAALREFRDFRLALRADRTVSSGQSGTPVVFGRPL